MKIKKIIISGFSLLLCTMFCINTVSAYELTTNSSISEIQLEEDEIKIKDIEQLLLLIGLLLVQILKVKLKTLNKGENNARSIIIF